MARKHCLRLCFGLRPAPLVWTKLMKIPISLRGKLNVWIVVSIGPFHQRYLQLFQISVLRELSLPEHNHSQQFMFRRTKVMERGETNVYHSGSISDDNSNRCFKLRLGSILPRDSNREKMVEERAILTYRYSITYYGEVRNFGFHQTQKEFSSTRLDRQQDCALLYSKNGRYREFSS